MAPGGFSRFLHPNRQSTHDEQYDPQTGRNLSDTTHPDYDPGTDPELRLRVTRTAQESIHQTIEEEDRRRFRRRFTRDHNNANGNAPGTPLSPRKRSIFSKKSFRRNPGSEPTTPDPGSALSPTFEYPPDEPEDQGARAELERQRTQANAAAEAEESARRQERQDGKKVKGKKGCKPNEQSADEKERDDRRAVYVNLAGAMTDPKGYERNKVRTSKYTLITFLPKNLMEQFRRVANIYFLLLVILQIFPIFGAAAPQIAMLPLVAILALTAIKDAIEDWRRQQLDDAVNNSAVTRLGDWLNVNKPEVTAKWWQFGKTADPVSKGVRRLREKEGTYDSTFLYNSDPIEQVESRETLADGVGQPQGGLPQSSSGYSLSTLGADTDSYPPSRPGMGRGRSGTLDTMPSFSGRSHASRKTSEVVRYGQPTPGTAKWERTLWKKLEVGDIVLLKDNDQIPADIIVLSTSEPEGVCFVETKNLDGETNLKPRKALKATMGIGNEEDIEHAQFWVDSEAPHANLYSYNATLKYRTRAEQIGMEHPIIEGRNLDGGEEKVEPITINELLLRGCALRNTKWVIGLVIYTGADTKIMLNQGETPSKRSKIEKETNFNVLVNFAVLMALCIVCGVAEGVFDAKSATSADFFEVAAEPSSSSILNGLVTFGAALILFQNIVPISLVITVELVKTIQSFFIYQDIEMYYAPLDHPCVPKTWNISDDLGQIEYIFSDKTGTLTQNVMEFQKCAVGGVAYGEGITEAMLGAAKREGRDTSAFEPAANAGRLAEAKGRMVATMKRVFKNRYLQEDQLTLISPQLAEDLVARGAHQAQLVEFWRALAICHTVLADHPDPEQPNKIDYKAESPDEAALVSAARDVGFAFVSRTNAKIEIEVMGLPEKYVPLRVLAFNSSRKRMSTLVRTPDNRILLICKGADSVIYQRLKPDHDPEVIASTTRHLEDFANAGLRTLCISSKYLTEEEFGRWSKIYDRACASIENREDEIERACEMIEGDLTILGATALEDKLQEGVPDAIEQLHKAGLKLWILTGDKLQTAIEIGFSCNLLSNEMEIMIISADSEEGARAQIETALDKVNRSRSGLGPASTDEKDQVKQGGFAVVIDGETLRYALEDNLKPMFLDLTTQCDTVVCCRVSPSQKALTVRLVKEGKGAMTLAIGDGANDVAMIQEAHIGVGIAGLEGAQASMSADYAVGQFRFLTRLLLVHGRWCYVRVADMHATFFYKNIVWTLTLFLFQIYCSFDGTYLYDYSLIMLFNLVFSSLPVAVLGIFDKDVSAETSLAVPQLYKRGMLGLEWTRPIFFGFMFDGFYQSCISFFIPYLVYVGSVSQSTTGHDFSVWEFGTTVAVCAVTSADLFVGLHIRNWTWIVFVVILASTLIIHVWIAIYSQFTTFNFASEVSYLYSTLNFWTCLIFTQVASMGPKYAIKYIQITYFPRDIDIVREMEVAGKCKQTQEMVDVEAQRHPQQQAPLVSGIPSVLDLGLANRANSHESSHPGSPYTPGHVGARPPFDFSVSSPARSRQGSNEPPRLGTPNQSPLMDYGGLGPISAVPTIQVEGSTPRHSTQSRYSEGSFLGSYAAGEYEPMPELSSAPASSNGASTPGWERDMADETLDARAQGHAVERSGASSAMSWTSAQEGNASGYAM